MLTLFTAYQHSHRSRRIHLGLSICGKHSYIFGFILDDSGSALVDISECDAANPPSEVSRCFKSLNVPHWLKIMELL